MVAAAEILVEATKKLFVVPNFVAVTKPFFFRVEIYFGIVFSNEVYRSRYIFGYIKLVEKAATNTELKISHSQFECNFVGVGECEAI